MVRYTEKNMKPENRGEYDLGISRDKSGRYHVFAGTPNYPLSKSCEMFERLGSEIIRIYQGIKPEIVFELLEKVEEIYKETLTVRDLDTILLSGER